MGKKIAGTGRVTRCLAHALQCLGLASLTLPACAYSDPGDGTHSLEVIGLMAYQISGNAEITLASFNVNKSNAPASAPNIVLTDTDTNQTFAVNQAQGVSWRVAMPGYRRHFDIKVSAGPDNLHCKLEGPGRHTITSPLQGEAHSVTDALTVNWQTLDGLKADIVDVELNQPGTTPAHLLDEDGSYTFLPSNLQGGDDAVTVTRRNKVIPAGGAGNSSIAAEYAVQVKFQNN